MQDGKISHLEHIFIRGSRVRFVIVPDMLKNAPMFKRIDPKNKMKVRARGCCYGTGWLRTSGGRARVYALAVLSMACASACSLCIWLPGGQQFSACVSWLRCMQNVPLGVGGRGRAVAEKAKARAGRV